METIGFNMAVANFRASIINKINGNGLPASVTLLILRDIERELEKEADRATNKEIEEYNKRKGEEHGESVYPVPMAEQAICEDTAGGEQA